ASAFFALGAGVASRRWSRDDKAPFPYSLRWILDFPHPISPDLLRRGVEPSEGDHVLGIGPGTGRHAVPVARWVAPTGTLDVFDVQQEAAPRRAGSGPCSAMARRSPTWRSSRPPDRPASGELLDAEGPRLLDDDHTVALRERSHHLSGECERGGFVRRAVAHGQGAPAVVEPVEDAAQRGAEARDLGIDELGVDHSERGEVGLPGLGLHLTPP